jgi:uncharacterized protein YndB with AHSA1/START domain
VSSSILVSLRVAAPRERVFEAFVGEIDKWWRPNPLFRFSRNSPGALVFQPGPDGRLIETASTGEIFEVGRITAWEPGVRLAFTWRQESFAPDQITYVEVRFEAVGDETRVTVEHRGWDAIPPEHVARHGFTDAVFLHRHAEWWRELLSSFGRRLSRIDST